MNVKEIEDEKLQSIINRHNSLSGILRELGLSETCPHSRKLLKKRFETLNLELYEQNKISVTPFHNNINYYKTDEEYFCLGDFRRSGTSIKERLIKHKGWEEKCNECNSLPIWNGKPLSLHVDHINGNGFDNRIENLRFLCPNCHSQTPTFGGRNKK